MASSAYERTKRYQARQLAKGQCKFCPTPLDLYKTVCNRHGLWRRVYKAKYRRHKLRGQGGRHGPLPFGERVLESVAGRSCASTAVGRHESI